MRYMLILLFAFVPTVSWAGTVENSASYRSLGMGGVRITTCTDSQALFANPAMLAKIEGINWTVGNIGAAVNGAEIADTISSFQAVTDINGFSQLYGKRVWVGLGAHSTFFVPHFSASLFDRGQIFTALHNPAYPNLDLTILNDYGYAVGGAIDLMADTLSMGVTAKRIVRTGSTTPVGLSTISNGSADSIVANAKNTGAGYGLDLGFALTPPWENNFKVGLVWKNIGNTQFVKTSGEAAPPGIDDEMAIGTSMGFTSSLADFLVGLDYRRINESGAFGNKLHLGMELNIPLMDLRAGFNQGYYTWGVGIDLFFLRLDFVSYAEELGSFPGQHGDRRYQLDLTAHLGFNPDLSFKSKKRKSRRIKIRR